MNKPMFSLHGQVIHVFLSPVGTNKDTGEEYGGQDKVQIMGELPLKNGETRMEMITLTTDQGDSLKKLVGKPVTLPVAFYAPSKGQVQYYIPKGQPLNLTNAA